MTSLLDVNVLVSLFDANHEHHAASMDWFNQSQDPWASCPITQNGYLRVVTQTGYPNSVSIVRAISTLAHAISTSQHKFLPDDISLLNKNIFAHRHIQGHKQLTDTYLFALSVSHGVCFVTLDQGVALETVTQATNESLHVIKT